MPKGGLRPGAGRPKGTIGIKQLPAALAAVDKALVREELRRIVAAELEPMVRGQIRAARGLNHFMLRDEATGQFKRLTKLTEIEAALNSGNPNAYWIDTKDPSTAAFVALMDRTIDKPTEHVDMTVSGDAALVERLQAARKRIEGAPAQLPDVIVSAEVERVQ